MKGVRCHHTQFPPSSAGVAGSPCGEECSRNASIWLSPVESGLKIPRAALVLCILSQATWPSLQERTLALVLSPSLKKRQLCLTQCLEDRKECWADDLILLLLLALALKSGEHSVADVTEAGAWKRLEPCGAEG